MNLSIIGESMEYDGKRYTVGDRVVATGDSYYAGLVGTIINIDYDEKPVSCFDRPRISCSFDVPIVPEFADFLTEKLYGYDDIEDLTELEDVYMSPHEIASLSDVKEDAEKKSIWVLVEEKVIDGKASQKIKMYLDYELALRRFEYVLRKEMESGMLSDMQKEDYIKDIGGLSYTFYQKDNFDKRRYSLKMEILDVDVSDDFIEGIGEEYITNMVRDGIREELMQNEDLSVLTDDECEELVKHQGLNEAFFNELFNNGLFNDGYSDTIGYVTRSFAKDILKKRKTENKEGV